MSFWDKLRGVFVKPQATPETTSTDRPASKSIGHDMSEAGFNQSGLGANILNRSWLTQYESNSSLRVPEHRVAEDSSLIRWHLWQKHPDGTRTEVHAHPIIDWWKQPEPGVLGIDWRYCFIVQVDLEGECFIWLMDPTDPGAGTVILSPDWLVSRPSKTNPKFVFRLPNGQTEDYSPREIVYAKRPNPRNPMGRGLGFGPAVAEDLQQLLHMNRFNSQFFRNGAHIGNVVGLDDISEEGWDRVEETYNQKYVGVNNAHKTLFVQGKITAKELGSSHKDLDYVAGWDQKKSTVRQVVGTPGEIVGDNKSSNKATSYESGNIHQTYGMFPRAVRLRDTVNTLILPLFDGSENLELDFEDPVKEKAELIALQYNQALDRGALSINEYRKQLGEDPKPGGEHVIWPLNMIPILIENLAALQAQLLARKGSGGSANAPTENPATASGDQSAGQVARALKTLLNALEETP